MESVDGPGNSAGEGDQMLPGCDQVLPGVTRCDTPKQQQQPTNKRNRSSEDGGGRVAAVDDEEEVSCGTAAACCDNESGAKKARSDSGSGEENGGGGAHSDSDSYDDLEDDFETPENMDDFLDEDDDDVMDEDDRGSTTSTRTTMSTGSVGSNTPSLVGENLESFSLSGEGGVEKTGSTAKALMGGLPTVRNTEPPLRRSLFSNTPPSVNFVHHNEERETPLPAELRKNLRWKLSNITPAVVKKVVTNSGFRLMRKNCTEWEGTWGKHMKSGLFKDLSESQKINHFPGTFNIGRKDRLWKNYYKLRVKFGKSEFSFLPRTFCMPAEARVLRKVWEKRGVKAKWIIKPPALARGNGIKVVNKWSQIPKNAPMIVQRYIARPHLINDTKYDLRIYVLVTSINPLVVYIYDEGLVRFASNKYETDNASLSDVFMHLTNYSINKNNSAYTPNEDPECRQGHKWTLASLWQYFAEAGIDSKAVWERVKDMAIKTIVSADHAIHPLARSNLASRNCGYELFGFDVLLDADLKPWLIEVNISPSLHSSSPLDLEVKSPLATEVFNIVRYHVPNKISAKSQRAILKKLGMEDISRMCFDPRLYTHDLSKADKAKQNRICAIANAGNVGGVGRDKYLSACLDKLTPDDVRCLIRAEDELAQTTRFVRIFPTPDTHRYFKYFQQPRYYNLLMDAWEHSYGDCRPAGIDRLERLCLDKVHLKVPLSTTETKAKAKAKVDTSGLKGPVPAAAAARSGAEEPSSLKPSGEQEGDCPATLPLPQPPPPPLVEASEYSESPPSSSSKSPQQCFRRIGVLAKPMHLKPNTGVHHHHKAVSSSKPSSSSTSKCSTTSPPPPPPPTLLSAPSSPEPMSTGPDCCPSSVANSDRSRTPSPVTSSKGELLTSPAALNDNSTPKINDSRTTAAAVSDSEAAKMLDNRPREVAQ